MNNTVIRQKASDFLKKFSLSQLSLDSLLKVFQNQGFDIIEYSSTKNSESVSKLISALDIEKYLSDGKALAYKSDDIKLIFICEDLTADEKLYALAHEEGHVFCGHLRNGNVLYSVEEEREANEFAHYILHPNVFQRAKTFIKQNKKLSIATLCLALVIIIMIPCSIHIFTSKDKPVYSETYNGNYYITQSGTKYHREDCTYIKGRKTQVLTEKKLKSGHYEPCKVCLPNE